MMPISIQGLNKAELLHDLYLRAQVGGQSDLSESAEAEVVSRAKRLAQGNLVLESVDLGLGERFLGVDLRGSEVDLSRYNAQYGERAGEQVVEAIANSDAELENAVRGLMGFLVSRALEAELERMRENLLLAQLVSALNSVSESEEASASTAPRATDPQESSSSEPTAPDSNEDVLRVRPTITIVHVQRRVAPTADNQANPAEEAESRDSDHPSTPSSPDASNESSRAECRIC